MRWKNRVEWRNTGQLNVRKRSNTSKLPCRNDVYSINAKILGETKVLSVICFFGTSCTSERSLVNCWIFDVTQHFPHNVHNELGSFYFSQNHAWNLGVRLTHKFLRLEENCDCQTKDESPENNGSFIDPTHAVSNRFSSSIATITACKVAYINYKTIWRPKFTIWRPNFSR